MKKLMLIGTACFFGDHVKISYIHMMEYHRASPFQKILSVKVSATRFMYNGVVLFI